MQGVWSISKYQNGLVKRKASKEPNENIKLNFLICESKLMACFQCQEEKVKNAKLFN